MNWEERIKQSDAGKLMPERAEEIVREATSKKTNTPTLDEVEPAVLKDEILTMYVIPQTRDEKITMYMKLTKRELAEMLINANDALDSRGWSGGEWTKSDQIPRSPVGSNTCLTS